MILRLWAMFSFPSTDLNECQPSYAIIDLNIKPCCCITLFTYCQRWGCVQLQNMEFNPAFFLILWIYLLEQQKLSRHLHFIVYCFFSPATTELTVNIWMFHPNSCSSTRVTMIWILMHCMSHSACCVTLVHKWLNPESDYTLDLITQCRIPRSLELYSDIQSCRSQDTTLFAVSAKREKSKLLIIKWTAYTQSQHPAMGKVG